MTAVVTIVVTMYGTAAMMLVAVALTSSVSARNQKPVLEEILNVDYAPP